MYFELTHLNFNKVILEWLSHNYKTIINISEEKAKQMGDALFYLLNNLCISSSASTVQNVDSLSLLQPIYFCDLQCLSSCLHQNYLPSKIAQTDPKMIKSLILPVPTYVLLLHWVLPFSLYAFCLMVPSVLQSPQSIPLSNTMIKSSANRCNWEHSPVILHDSTKSLLLKALQPRPNSYLLFFAIFYLCLSVPIHLPNLFPSQSPIDIGKLTLASNVPLYGIRNKYIRSLL